MKSFTIYLTLFLSLFQLSCAVENQDLEVDPSLQDLKVSSKNIRHVDNEFSITNNGSRGGLVRRDDYDRSLFNEDNPYTKFNINKVLEMVNDIRRRNGVPPLTVDIPVYYVAMKHSWDQSRQGGGWTHLSSDGSGISERMKAVDIKYAWVGECVGLGYESLESAMNAFIQSEPHFKILVDPKPNMFGAGFWKKYWTLNFAEIKE